MDSPDAYGTSSVQRAKRHTGARGSAQTLGPMNALDWLAEQQDGFGNLPKTDQKEMMEFSLLWAYFEARLLAANASPKSIASLAAGIADAEKLQPESLIEPIAYWRARYVQEGEFTHHYHFLNLRPNDNIKVVNAVLLGQEDSPKALLICALTIVYRYRNNLFHGLKWAYGLQGQKGNFQVASRVLIATTEMARAPENGA